MDAANAPLSSLQLAVLLEGFNWQALNDAAQICIRAHSVTSGGSPPSGDFLTILPRTRQCMTRSRLRAFTVFAISPVGTECVAPSQQPIHNVIKSSYLPRHTAVSAKR
jgi:hypothetical protein